MGKSNLKKDTVYGKGIQSDKYNKNKENNNKNDDNDDKTSCCRRQELDD